MTDEKHVKTCTTADACTCPACRFGLFCADGKRGEFERGKDVCKACGVVAWLHSNQQRCRRGAR